MHALILSALLCAAPVPPVEAPFWRPDPDGTCDLGLWLGDRFLGRWVAERKQYLPYDDGRYGPPCLLPPDAPQYRQTAPPPLANYKPTVNFPTFYSSPVFFGGCPGGRCPR